MKRKVELPSGVWISVCEPECKGPFELARDDITGMCQDCRDHCSVVDHGCDCGGEAGTTSDCCGAVVHFN